jgi:transposase-like protein/IS1 family transposase
MTCTKCNHGTVKKFGKYGKEKIQRYRCNNCSKTFTQPRSKPIGNHYTDIDIAAQVVTLMMEGMSIRAISRITGLHKSTVLSLILTIGDNCHRVFDIKMRGVRPRFVEADELHGFVHTKQQNLSTGDPDEWGSSFLWIAIDSESKAVLSYHVGKRHSEDAREFMGDLSSRVERPFQLTTDAFPGYLPVVEEFFGADISYAQLIKVYGQSESAGPGWYGPAKVISTIQTRLRGRPDVNRISTSIVERFNLSVRTCLRRYTRLSLGFSKSMKHLKAAVSIFMAWHNLCRIHGSLRVTPMMEAKIENHVWSVRELIMGATQI